MSRGRVAGKVALVTGAGRGMGRSHCLELAKEGADILAVDVCANVDGIPYPMSRADDLDSLAKEITALGRKVVTAVCDVRDRDDLTAAVEKGVAVLGRLDVVVTNAGVVAQRRWTELPQQSWDAVIGTNLTGVWNTLSAAVPHLIAAGGGSVICIGSTGAIKGLPFLAPYVAAKHAVVGLAKTAANEFADQNIRVNVVHPTGVQTPMNDLSAELPKLIAENPAVAPIFTNALPVDKIDPIDVSQAVLFLASDESRYVTGTDLKVDAGNTIR